MIMLSRDLLKETKIILILNSRLLELTKNAEKQQHFIIKRQQLFLSKDNNFLFSKRQHILYETTNTFCFSTETAHFDNYHIKGIWSAIKFFPSLF